MASQSNIGMKFKSSPGSMEAAGSGNKSGDVQGDAEGSGNESGDVQEDAEVTPSRAKKKDNTLLLVGVAALALMAMKGR